jgi:hypothetical protein
MMLSQAEPPPVVRLSHKLTGGEQGRALFVQIAHAETGALLAEYPSPRWAHIWLTTKGYAYVAGSNGLWHRGA